jgi:hypothetical protein
MYQPEIGMTDLQAYLWIRRAIFSTYMGSMGLVCPFEHM